MISIVLLQHRQKSILVVSVTVAINGALRTVWFSFVGLA